MATSLNWLRRYVGEDLGECVWGYVDDGGADWIQHESLIDPDEDPSRYDRAWLRLFPISEALVAQAVRRVRLSANTPGYDPDLGIIHFAPPLTGMVAGAGSIYEMHTLLSPELLDRLIVNGLRKCPCLRLTEVEVVSEQTEYSLAAGSRTDVVNVYLKSGDTEDEYRYVPISWYSVSEDEGALVLHLRETPSTDDIVVEYLGNWGDLIGTSSYIDCPEPWARAAVQMEVYRHLSQFGPAQDAKRYRNMLTEATAEFRVQTRTYAPRPPRRIQLPDSGVY